MSFHVFIFSFSYVAFEACLVKLLPRASVFQDAKSETPETPHSAE